MLWLNLDFTQVHVDLSMLLYCLARFLRINNAEGTCEANAEQIRKCRPGKEKFIRNPNYFIIHYQETVRGDFIVYPGKAESICRFPCASNIILVKLLPEFMY